MFWLNYWVVALTASVIYLQVLVSGHWYVVWLVLQNPFSIFGVTLSMKPAEWNQQEQKDVFKYHMKPQWYVLKPKSIIKPKVWVWVVSLNTQILGTQCSLYRGILGNIPILCCISKPFFYIKNLLNLSNLFFIEKYHFRNMSFFQLSIYNLHIIFAEVGRPWIFVWKKGRGVC